MKFEIDTSVYAQEGAPVAVVRTVNGHFTVYTPPPTVKQIAAAVGRCVARLVTEELNPN